MQNAYATSKDALPLLAEAETLMGRVRSGDDALPQSGQAAAVNLRDADSLDAIATPRQCALQIGNEEARTHLTLTPRVGLSAEKAVTEALTATQAAIQDTARKEASLADNNTPSVKAQKSGKNA